MRNKAAPTSVFQFRADQDIIDAIYRAAELQKIKPSEYVRRVLIPALQRDGGLLNEWDSILNG